MQAEAVALAELELFSPSAAKARSQAARRRSREVELQAIAIIWLGVTMAIAGIAVLLMIGDKLIAGGMTFGGAAVLLIGLLRGAYGQYLYWRMSTD